MEYGFLTGPEQLERQVKLLLRNNLLLFLPQTGMI